MARRTTSLGPTPSFSVLFCFCCFWGRVKGQVSWPKGPPHLALNAPYFFWFVFFSIFPFPFLGFWKKTVFPLKRGISCLLFSVSLSFSLACCFTSLFHSHFLCLSPVLFFLSSFLLSSLLSFASLFGSLSLFFFLLWFCFIKRTTLKILKFQVRFSSILSISFFSVLFFFQIPFPYLCFIPDFKFCFCSRSMIFFRRSQVIENTNFGSRAGLQQNVVFIINV